MQQMPAPILHRMYEIPVSPQTLPGIIEALWKEESKFGLWLDVELNLVIAWAAKHPDVVPAESAFAIVRDAKFNTDDIAAYERETHHDVTAFIRSVQDSLGNESRYFHYGVTSSDIVDTATAIIMSAVLGLCCRVLRDAIPGGRGDINHPTAIWLWEQLNRLQTRVRYGQFSGPVGTNATLPRDVEEDACAMSGLKTLPVSTQIIPRDIHADYVLTIARVVSMLARILDLNNRLRWEATLVRSNCVAVLEDVALWHERDISHSSVERLILPQASTTLAKVLSVALEG